ncbi:hypothetical protein, unknown function [Leishmania mexicana MHOM/GT/2001/U1103]|uniref:Uncharacterized protein n=1 Tax=Leishmania mexicana (strain MHOM/GT/2001/U1103) TaxID=929439 RepID=E9B4E0_LEIMU|nr:hypothetical protein, unknown function [Leishmania mexicana MHOM/GT/2001/U1103]CBZ30108.1 hypothetical protein, unknown function [Leishmania mexicana MHOM/GT/2001/U1103]
MHFFYRAVTASNLWVAPIVPSYALPLASIHTLALTDCGLENFIFFLICCVHPLHYVGETIQHTRARELSRSAALFCYRLSCTLPPVLSLFQGLLCVCVRSCRRVVPSVHLFATSFRGLNITVYSVIHSLRPPFFRAIFAHYRLRGLSLLPLTVHHRAGFTQMQGNMYSRQMEWAVHQQQPQRMQDNLQGVASRAYHLEPISPLQTRQQGGCMPGMMVGQQPGCGVMNGLSAYGPRPMIGDAQDGHMGPQPGDVARATGYGTQGMHGNNSMGCGPAGMGGANNLQNGNAVLFAAGPAAKTPDWNNINFNGIFSNAVNPQVQSSVEVQDDGEPLPFPPGNLLAQYPLEYQQQLIFYYRLLRLQYPELYKQYVDYYVMYYEPLYHPAPPSLSKDDLNANQPRKKEPSPRQTQRAQMQPQQPVMPQPVHQSPRMEHPMPPEGIGRTTSNLSGGLKRQSSLRRQNSMRRNEVNQLKNEGSLKRLSSMRQQ